jgi:hypothetical protein
MVVDEGEIIALVLEGTECFCSEVCGQIALDGIFVKTVFKYWEVAVRFKSGVTEQFNAPQCQLASSVFEMEC